MSSVNAIKGVHSMDGASGIEWCGETWEVTAGCAKVSSGCANCYAETMVGGRLSGAARTRKREGKSGMAVDMSLEVIDPKTKRWNGEVRELAMNLEQPLNRQKPTVYFVNSRSDLFHEGVDFAYIDKVLAVMALCPQHRFLILTKRPERMREYFDAKGIGLDPRIQDAAWHHFGKQLSCSIPLSNVWLGTSVEDQAACDARVPELLACPVGEGAGRFISAEPLLGAVSLGMDRELLTDLMDVEDRDERHRGKYPFSGVSGDAITRRKHAINWVIVGGESGRDARVCRVEWIRSIVAQCRNASVPVFVKQMGTQCHDFDDDRAPCANTKVGTGKGNDPGEWPEDLRVREVPEALVLERGGA